MNSNIPFLVTLGPILLRPPQQRIDADIKILRELTSSISFFNELSRNYSEKATDN